MALALTVLLILRGAQWLSIAPLLHDPEWLQFADLARVLQAGELERLLPGQLFPQHSYMPFSQGVAILSLFAWFLSPLLGVSSWALQACSLLAEALAVALLAALLSITHSRSSWRALALAPWLLAPGFAVVWQILPFGNHTELQWVPLAVALFIVWSPPDRRPWWHLTFPLVVLAFGLFCYRGTLPVLVAFVLWGAWSGSRRLLLGSFAVGGLTLALVTVSLLGIYGGGFLENPDRFLLAHELGASFGVAAPIIGEDPFLFPTAPRDLPSWPYLALLLVALPLALFGCFRAPRGPSSPDGQVRRFVLLWASLAFLACALDSFPRQPHCLPALYALLVNAGLLLGAGVPRAVRWAGGVIVGLLAAAGLRDGVATIHPDAWRDALRYEGVALYEQLDVRAVDGDDWPWFQRLVDEGRTHPHVGVVTHAFCNHGLRDRVFLPHPEPSASRCGCEEAGWVGRVLQEAIERGPQADPFQAGRGAWIYCGRDLGDLERGLEGMPAELFEEVMAGARHEAEASGVEPR